MLTLKPDVPHNLTAKLTTSVRTFQRKYDTETLGDVRRLLRRHGFRMPVLCSFSYHQNGNLKQVHIKENLNCKTASSNQASGNLRILESAEQGTSDIEGVCLKWFAEICAKHIIDNNLHVAMTLSDEDITNRRAHLSDYSRLQNIRYRDVSSLVSRRVLDHERILRQKESNHARLVRCAVPLPKKLLDCLEEEKDQAFEWRDASAAGGWPVSLHYDENLCDDERTVLEYRNYRYLG